MSTPSVPADGNPESNDRRVRVGWNGTDGASCHLSLDRATWNTAIVKIPVGTELQILGETQTAVIWESEYTVWKVEYEDQTCYIRTQLAEELPLTTRP